MLGLHSETVPLAWPSDSTALCGFCRMTSHVPSRVLCCATICPVLVSCIGKGRLCFQSGLAARCVFPYNCYDTSDGQLRLRQPCATSLPYSAEGSMQTRNSLPSTRLVAKHPSFADGRQKEVIRQELQPPHPRVLL